MNFPTSTISHAYAQVALSNPSADSTSRPPSNDTIRELEERVERLAILSQSMWELLRQTNGFTDSDILSKLEEIDLRDGQRDGKMSATVAQCPNCPAKISSKRNYCMVCGTHYKVGEVFAD